MSNSWLLKVFCKTMFDQVGKMCKDFPQSYAKCASCLQLCKIFTFYNVECSVGPIRRLADVSHLQEPLFHLQLGAPFLLTEAPLILTGAPLTLKWAPFTLLGAPLILTGAPFILTLTDRAGVMRSSPLSRKTETCKDIRLVQTRTGSNQDWFRKDLVQTRWPDEQLRNKLPWAY